DAHAVPTRSGLPARARTVQPRNRGAFLRAPRLGRLPDHQRENGPQQMKEEQDVGQRQRGSYDTPVETTDRHLRLLTETIAAVNSTLDLEEVLHLVANEVAAALEADACFVYLYDETAGELVLRATHGTPLDEMTRRPRLRPGEGITGTAAAELRPVALAANADLDPRWKEFPNLPESEYESILAVPILAREQLAGALNVRTREAREFRADEIELLQAIAGQVAQSIVHAQLYTEAQRRVAELEALARISEAVSESLYLEESLEAIVKTTMDAVHATGAALVLEDGLIAWPEGRAGAYAVRTPLRWKRREIGELVADKDVPFTDEERALLEALTEQREEDVELAELIDRLRAMLVQGLGGGRDVQARLEPVPLAGSRATALALVFSELLQNALEHGAGTVRIELARRDSDVVLAIT